MTCKFVMMNLRLIFPIFCVTAFHLWINSCEGARKRLEHFGNYKEMVNESFAMHCPQLSPNYNNEHCMSFEEFKEKSFFACGHKHNKAHSIPSDYYIKGTYSSLKWTCDPTKTDRDGVYIREKRDQLNYESLKKEAVACRDQSKDSAKFGCPTPAPPTTEAPPTTATTPSS